MKKINNQSILRDQTDQETSKTNHRSDNQFNKLLKEILGSKKIVLMLCLLIKKVRLTTLKNFLKKNMSMHKKSQCLVILTSNKKTFLPVIN